jgi:hypothetical protein
MCGQSLEDLTSAFKSLLCEAIVMFDDICSEIRNIIHDAIDENVVGWTELEAILAERKVEGVCMTYVDDGIALTVGKDSRKRI